ncbi:hypothetical protein RvY_02188 [Ramazzottius varieornatus]|uniref:Uncharacterized protein n=1 Tax=Ramazzottius varieornatus TaxID=947166 RepID=A0A1D1UJN8_RAMVA|nr:hypothetical protein RvY_02188 [Ramazzottius varieornatus]
MNLLEKLNVFWSYSTIIGLVSMFLQGGEVFGAAPARGLLAKEAAKLVIDGPQGRILYKCPTYSLRFTVTTTECHADLCGCLYNGVSGAYLYRVCAKHFRSTDYNISFYCKDAHSVDSVDNVRFQVNANSSLHSSLDAISLYGSREDDNCDQNLDKVVSHGRQVETVSIQPCNQKQPEPEAYSMSGAHQPAEEGTTKVVTKVDASTYKVVVTSLLTTTDTPPIAQARAQRAGVGGRSNGKAANGSLVAFFCVFVGLLMLVTIGGMICGRKATSYESSRASRMQHM